MPESLRLPTEVAPTHYDLRIEADLVDQTFSGTVGIDLDVDAPVTTLSCHALELSIESATVDGQPAAWNLDETSERLELQLGAELVSGRARLEVRFSGTLNEHLVGFYRSTYTDDTGQHVLGVTQFEATDARRAFPCWDEPVHKATFAITLVVAPDLLAISNAEEISRRVLDDGRVEHTFAPTIRMSTYLVAWVIGRMVATEPVDVDGVPLRVICRPGQEHLTGEAVDIAAHALRWYSEYYGIPYPGDKLDLVAVPDFAFGAMENLGCITFRDVLLVLDPDRLTQVERERATTVIDHEIAHMWFGDLVTMKWWEGIWLNEAFATFMELCCADDYRPEWSVWTTFGLSRSQAFATDGTTHTRPIEFEVVTPKDADAMFDVLTYEKGGSVLRMVERHLGAEVFRSGIRNYLDRHRYGNTDTGDLWAALDEVSDVPVSEVMDTWIHQGGHPIVSVRVEGDSVRLRQEPFAYSGSGEGSWLVPVRLSAGSGGPLQEQQILLGVDEATVTFDRPFDWVCANADGLGFYRTRYEPDAFAALLTAKDGLQPLERFGLIDDTWALMLAGSCGLAPLTAALRANAGDDHPAVLRRIATGLAELGLMGGSAHAEAVGAFARSLMSDRADDVVELAGIAMRIAGSVGHDREVVSRAEDLLVGSGFGTPVSAELVAAAIDVVASNGDSTWFERFVERYRSAATPQEELRYLNALTRFPEPELQDRLLDLLVTEVRTQNAPYVLAMSLSNPVVGTRAWTFMRDRWDDLIARFPDNSISRMVGGIRSVWDPDTANDILEFFASHRVGHDDRQVRQHVEMVHIHQATHARELGGLDASLS